MAMAAYVAVFSTLCILRYATSRHGDPDFGVFEQSFWTTLRHGLLFVNTYEGGSHFRIHNSPVFFLLLPFYAAAPSMATLLVLQTAAVAAGAWGVFLLARDRLARAPFDAAGGERAAAVLAVTYLLYHPLHGVNYDQFNELSFAVAPLVFAMYFLGRGRMAATWGCVLLLVATKEDMAFVVMALGVYAAACGAREGGWRAAGVRHGLLLCGFGALWLMLSLRVIFPWFRGGEAWPYFSLYYPHLGSSMGQAVLTMLTHPVLVTRYAFSPRALQLVGELLLPLAFIPLLAPEVLLMVAPTWLILTLSAFQGTTNTGSRYMAPIVAILFVALVIGLQRAAASRPLSLPQLARWPLVLSLLCMLALDNTPTRFPFKNVPRFNDHLRARQSLVAQIPAEASVATQADFYGHVAHRMQAWTEFDARAEYLLVDPTPHFALWFRNAHFDRALPDVLANGQYTLVAEADGARLYRRVR